MCPEPCSLRRNISKPFLVSGLVDFSKSVVLKTKQNKKQNPKSFATFSTWHSLFCCVLDSNTPVTVSSSAGEADAPLIVETPPPRGWAAAQYWPLNGAPPVGSSLPSLSPPGSLPGTKGIILRPSWLETCDCLAEPDPEPAGPKSP